MRTCGGCVACCKIMPVVELNKGSEWCRFCNIGHGCTIYADRPQSCADFHCQWLISEKHLDDSLRPDRVRVVLTATADHKLVAHCDPATPLAWRNPKIYALLRQGAESMGHSIARAGARFWVITSDRDWEAGADDLIREDREVKVVVPYLGDQPQQRGIA